MAKDKWYVIGRGKAGWHAKGINISSSGGFLNDHTPPFGNGTTYRGYINDAVEGCLVYDADQADAAAFVKLIISGPMVDPRLPADGVDRLTDDLRHAAARMAPALSGGFKTLAIMAQSTKFSGLDSVGVDIYRALLETVPGIKIGTVRNGKVEWDAVPVQPKA